MARAKGVWTVDNRRHGASSSMALGCCEGTASVCVGGLAAAVHPKHHAPSTKHEGAGGCGIICTLRRPRMARLSASSQASGRLLSSAGRVRAVTQMSLRSRVGRKPCHTPPTCSATPVAADLSPQAESLERYLAPGEPSGSDRPAPSMTALVHLPCTCPPLHHSTSEAMIPMTRPWLPGLPGYDGKRLQHARLPLVTSTRHFGGVGGRPKPQPRETMWMAG
ncbi:hypothetical protein EJ04DRAFT_592739 [Polyplosphaeria fusca]|uniref:Uncharacterized protein n=1 Tax=Polyplosphaeria fusca TaxID=682080 RepID=A0A9P4V970_9PLEO|nr:hypothetical protein EJ04DRAFT_592739 [Polyplosphaeria fusca]